MAGASGLCVFLASLITYSFAVLLKPLAAEFGWSRQAIAASYSIMAVTSGAAAPFFGRLLDRFAPRRIIVPAVTVVAAAFTSLSLLTPRLWHLYLLFALIGTAGVGTTALAYSRAVSTWFDRHRGLALSLIVVGAAIGAMVHPPLTQALVARVGWRGACLGLGAFYLIAGVATALAFVRERPATLHAVRGGGDGASVREALGQWSFWVLFVMVFGSTLTLNGAVVHLVALLTDRGIAPGRAAVAVSAMGAASLVGRLVTGWLLDRVSGSRVACVLLTTAAAGTYLLASAPSLGTGVLAAALIGAGSGGELDVMPYLLSRYFGLRALSSLYGIGISAMCLAGVVGPTLLARAFDATGSYEGMLVRFAAATLGIAALMLTLPAAEPLPEPSRA